MKIPRYARLPVCLIGVSLVVCLLLAILPVDQILVSYAVRNGVESIVFVPKIEGILRIIVLSVVFGFLWIWLNRRFHHSSSDALTFFGIRVNKNSAGFFLGFMMVLASAMGIISIIIWILGM